MDGMGMAGSFEHIRDIWRRSAETVAALLCGAFSALGLRGFDSPADIFSDGYSVFGFAMAVLFTLIVASGISTAGCSRWPRYVFSLSLMATAISVPEYDVLIAILFLYIPLFLLLVFCVRWRGARLAALPLSLVLAWNLSADGWDADREPFPEASYLPTSLLAERPGARMLVRGEGLPAEWWRQLGYVSAVDEIATAASARKLRGGSAEYDVAVVDETARGDGPRRELYRLVCSKLKKSGVLVVPAAEIDLLPHGDWRFAKLPGSEGTWLAGGDGFVPVTDPEMLDGRLQEFCRDEPEASRLLLAGAYAALYPREETVEIKEPVASSPVRSRHGLWPWAIGAIALWGLFRLWGCRKEHVAAAVASAENMAAMTLYTLAAFSLWGPVELYTGMPSRILVCGAGVLLLPLGSRPVPRRLLILCCALVGILPLCFAETSVLLLPLCWSAWMLSGAFVMNWLLEDGPAMIWIGAGCGVAAGVAIGVLLLPCGAAAFPAALAVSLVLRSVILLRR